MLNQCACGQLTENPDQPCPRCGRFTFGRLSTCVFTRVSPHFHDEFAALAAARGVSINRLAQSVLARATADNRELIESHKRAVRYRELT